jgi:hypothetical protein
MWLFKRSLYLINQIHSICYCKIAYFTRKDTKGVIRSRKSKKDWPHNSYKNKMNCELILTYDTPALRQSGSRNLTGQKMLPTIWGTYMKLVTKYKISAPSIVAERSPKREWVYCFISVYLYVRPSSRPSFRPSKIFFVAFFSVTVDGRHVIFGHIGIPYCG